MRAPYKYPYISIFILGYYFLEHEGYYYKLRSFFGYSVDEKINYVISLEKGGSTNLTKAPGRKSLIHYWDVQNAEHSEIFKKLARSYKEKLRSPLIFADKPCSPDDEICKQHFKPFIAYYFEGTVQSTLDGEFNKKKIKKFIKGINKA